MPACRIRVNGSVAAVSSGSTLLLALRDELGLKATRIGCCEGDCGACTVLVDGRPTQSCSIACADVKGDVETIEAGAQASCAIGAVHACFLEEQAAQCGYCTNGIIMTVAGMLGTADRAAIVAAIDERHICRCGAHPRILRAIDRALTCSGARG